MIPGLSKQRIEAGHLAQGVAAVAFSRCQLTVEPIWQLSPEMELDDWLGLMTYSIPLFGWIYWSCHDCNLLPLWQHKLFGRWPAMGTSSQEWD
jgi:hypothetical protein